MIKQTIAIATAILLFTSLIVPLAIIAVQVQAQRNNLSTTMSYRKISDRA